MTDRRDPRESQSRPRRVITGDSRPLRNAVIVLLLLLAGIILFGVGMLAIDLSKRASIQWERIKADFDRPGPAREKPEPSEAAPSVTAPEAIPGFAELPRARPLTSPATWLTTDDYPTESLRREEEGSVAIAYVVGIDGRVETCVVERSSGFSRLDQRTCSLVKANGRFAPALDATGKPRRGRGRLRFRWQIAE